MSQLRNRVHPGAQGLPRLEGSISRGVMASQRKTGGVAGCSALEKDGPVTCDPLDRPWDNTPVKRGPGNQPSNALQVDGCTCSRSGRKTPHRTSPVPKVGTLKRGVEAEARKCGRKGKGVGWVHASESPKAKAEGSNPGKGKAARPGAATVPSVE